MGHDDDSDEEVEVGSSDDDDDDDDAHANDDKNATRTKGINIQLGNDVGFMIKGVGSFDKIEKGL